MRQRRGRRRFALRRLCCHGEGAVLRLRGMGRCAAAAAGLQRLNAEQMIDRLGRGPRVRSHTRSLTGLGTAGVLSAPQAGQKQREKAQARVQEQVRLQAQVRGGGLVVGAGAIRVRALHGPRGHPGGWGQMWWILPQQVGASDQYAHGSCGPCNAPLCPHSGSGLLFTNAETKSAFNCFALSLPLSLSL